MDRRARRTLSAREKRLLLALAAMVMEQIELRRYLREAKGGLQRIGRLAAAGAKAAGAADAKRWDVTQGECKAALSSLKGVQMLSQRAGRKHERPMAAATTPGPGTAPRRRVRQSDRRKTV